MRILVLLLALSLSALAQPAGAHSVTITLSDPNIPPVNNYNIYRAQAFCSAATAFTKIASGITGTMYVDNAVAAGTPYCYYATAVSGGAESVPGLSVGVTVPAPLPPTITVTAN